MKPVNVMGTLAEIAVGTDVADSSPIDTRTSDELFVAIPTGSNLTSLGLHVAPTADATFTPLADANGLLSLAVVAGRAFHLPASASRWGGFLKLSGNTSGSVFVYGARPTN